MGFYNESGGGGGAANIPLIKRNNFINGGFQVDQRNAGASQIITASAAKAYTVDRWYAYCEGADVTGQRVAGSGQDQYRYQFTGAGGNTLIQFGQRIEASHCYFANGQDATLSVDLANSLLTTVTWTAYYANTTDTFGTIASPTRTQIATGTFTVSSTLARYSTQIAIPVAATTGIEIVFSVANQTSGTWTIGNAQLEMGTVATPFERETSEFSFERCFRYFQPWRFCTAYSVTSSLNIASFTLPFMMRASPTVTRLGAGITSRENGSGVSALFISENGMVTLYASNATNSAIGGSGYAECEL